MGATAPRLTLRAAEVFVAVVEGGSVAAGAARLGASPSSVSQSLTNLEAALGARLLDRTARPLALTPAGFVFQRRALAMLDAAAGALSDLADLELTALPQLRLALVDELDAEVNPALVRRLAGMLPGCTFTVITGPSHRNLAALEERAVDLTVAAETGPAPDRIERHALLREPYLLVAARGLLAGAEGEAAVARLMQAPLVRYAASLVMGRQIEAHLRRLRLAPPRRFEFEANRPLMATVADIGGWALTTPLGWADAGAARPGLEAHPLPFPAFGRTLVLEARAGALGRLPGRAATILRSLVADRCLAPALATAPWLEGTVRLLGPTEPPATEPRSAEDAPEDTPSAGRRGAPTTPS